jgi:hypothetical protein
MSVDANYLAPAIEHDELPSSVDKYNEVKQQEQKQEKKEEQKQEKEEEQKQEKEQKQDVDDMKKEKNHNMLFCIIMLNLCLMIMK